MGIIGLLVALAPAVPAGPQPGGEDPECGPELLAADLFSHGGQQ